MNNVYQYPLDMKGRWHEIFGNQNPITLELACGKAEYTTGRAPHELDRNFIAVDVKGNRLYIGAQKALDQNLQNTRFLRIDIDKIYDYFEEGEVDDIWIIFPDPFLKEKRAKNRLTHPKFLSKYQDIIKKDTSIHLKTDSRELYDFTKATLEEYNCSLEEDIYDIYKDGEADFPLSIKTFYEGMHLEDGRTISYLRFGLPKEKIQYVKKKKETSPE